MIYKLLQKSYNALLRPYLPSKIGLSYSVATNEKKLFDIQDHIPHKKMELLEYIRENTFPGDHVLVIGGGGRISSGSSGT
jgi:hypothetical protein